MTIVAVRHAQLRVIAQLADRSLDEVYRLFRLPGAPAPAMHVACVPVYEVEEALEWLGRSASGRSRDV